MAKIKILFAVFVLLLSFSCLKDRIPVSPIDDTDPSEIQLRIQVNTPDVSRLGTRAVAESALDNIIILVLQNTGGVYTYQYRVPGYSITSTGAGEYEFMARLLPSANPLRLILLGNAGTAVNAVTTGMTEDEVKAAVTRSYTAAGFDDVLPMTATVDFPGGLLVDTPIDNVSLLRSAARVDVVNSAANFVLTEVYIYRAANQLQLIPNALTGNSVTVPSIPAGTTRSITTPAFPVTGTSLTQQIYIPESPAPAAGDRRLTATAVVVGGQFDGSGVTTYYRMDFDPDDDTQNLLFGQVLRNHLYRFNITDVLAPGWPTPDDASLYPSTGIEADIVVWDDVDMYMVFDGYDHLGVSARRVNLSYRLGSNETISVDTSLETYTAYWSDSTGNIIDGSESAAPGGDADDPDGLFNVAVSADGTSITVTSLTEYTGATDQVRYVLLSAGRLRILVTVSQGPGAYRPDTSINVYGTASGIGSLGNYVLPPTVANGERTGPYVRMLQNPAYFGPSGVVPIDGIFISGLSSTASLYPAPLLSLYDVIYLPWLGNPDPATILEWMSESSNRVLIIQFDNTATNSLMMAALGVTYTQPGGSSPIPPYTLSADAPGFITNGPFGIVDNTLQFRTYDDTYGRISLADAQANNITPILLTPDGTGVSLGVDQTRRIVYCGDIDMYWAATNSHPGLTIPSTGETTNQAAVLFANLWAWIIDSVLKE